MSSDLTLLGYPLQGWQLLLGGLLGPGLAWFGGHRLAMRQLRLAERAQDVSGGKAVADAASQLLGQVRTQMDWAQQELTRYRAEIEQLRAYRYTLDERLNGLFEAALAARTMVHELQRRHGEPETVFPPLASPAGQTAPVPPRP